MLKSIPLMALFATLSTAQVYMHAPRGSNNRLNEQTDTVTTANRLFLSNNNARGGYNVGDRAVAAFNGANPTVPLSKMYDVNDIATTGQYSLQYFEGSQLTVEWMNQHGCGDSSTDPTLPLGKTGCDMVLQYMCQTTTDGSLNGPAAPLIMGAENLVDGGNTGRPAAPTTQASVATVKAANDKALVGRHESEQFYYECSKRQRNQGLFSGDLTLKGATALYDRQNPQGTQNGLECSEERDYYPYWSPSPWIDIALLTDDAAAMCTAGKYTYGSQNDHKVFKCVPAAGTTDEATIAKQLSPITEAGCTTAGGTWTAYTNAMPTPDCLQAPWSRDNHLGNGLDGVPLGYNWTLPTIASLTNKGVALFTDGQGGSFAKCVMRFRYNVTGDDIDGAALDSTANTGASAPISGSNPVVDIGNGVKVQVALSAQNLATTYEDRSHIFYIRQRPTTFASAKIVNLGVRGKRANIVQAFPAIEYDFSPQQLTVDENTVVHIQWTGSNSGQNAAGTNDDGQSGDAGEGTDGTDRSSIMQVTDLSANYPIPLDKFTDNMWTRSNCYLPSGNYLSALPSSATQAGGASSDAATECALWLSTSGQFRSLKQVQAAGNNDFQVQLNAAPASLIGGVLLNFAGQPADTDYYYIATRNNNFTNRGQKATISIRPSTGKQATSKAAAKVARNGQ